MATKVGIRIRNSHGTVQIDDNWIGMALRSKGTFTLEVDPSNRPQPMLRASLTVAGIWPIIAFNPGNNATSMYGSQNNGNGTWTFHFRCQGTTPATVEYWVFDQMDQGIGFNSLGYGLRVRRQSDGKVVFDAGCRPMRIAGIIDYPMPAEVLPPTGSPQSGLHGTLTFNGVAGRKYAAIQGAFGYIPTMWDSGAYSSDTQPPAAMRDADGEIQPSTKWRYMFLEGINSTVAFPSTTQARAGMTRFERWEDWYVIGTQPHIEVNGSCVHWIIDVTGY